MEEEYSSALDIKTGVKQGDRISPLLFNVMLQEALEEVGEEDQGISIGTKINVIALADNIALIAQNIEDLKIIPRMLFIRAREKRLNGDER